ncbi:MAG: hypothetical protein EPO65_09435 [Dehalococcoidia bacterium]|nr:MAG: hypothetical protein EPO65_09435 [Dehalococcoidia bacterium]
MSPGPSNGWIESTEGDLDPDLTEEAEYGHYGYGSSHPWLRPALQAFGALVLIAFLGGAILAVLGG